MKVDVAELVAAVLEGHEVTGTRCECGRPIRWDDEEDFAFCPMHGVHPRSDELSAMWEHSYDVLEAAGLSTRLMTCEGPGCPVCADPPAPGTAEWQGLAEWVVRNTNELAWQAHLCRWADQRR